MDTRIMGLLCSVRPPPHPGLNASPGLIMIRGSSIVLASSVSDPRPREITQDVRNQC